MTDLNLILWVLVYDSSLSSFSICNNNYYKICFSSVAQSCPTLCDLMNRSTPGLPVHHQLPEPTQTYVHWVDDAIQPSHPLLSPSPPAFNLSQHQGLFQWVTSSHQVAKVLEFQLQHQSFQWRPRTDLLHHSSKASILQCSTFFIVQLSHPYMTTGKTIALTRRTFVGKVMSLLFNMMSRLVIIFLPRSKRLLISWLQSPSAVTLEPPKIKSATVATVSPSICHEVMGPDAMILVFWMLSFKPTFSLSPFTFISRLFSSSLSAIRVVSSAFLRLLIFLLAILISCASSSPAFLTVYSAYKLNKHKLCLLFRWVKKILFKIQKNKWGLFLFDFFGLLGSRRNCYTPSVWSASSFVSTP